MNTLFTEARRLSFIDAKHMILEIAENLDVALPSIRSWAQLEIIVNELIQPVIDSAKEEKRTVKRVAREVLKNGLLVGEQFTTDKGDTVQVLEVNEHTARIEYFHVVDEFQTMQAGDRESVFFNRLMGWTKNEHNALVLPNTQDGARNLETGARSQEHIQEIHVIGKEWFDRVNGNSYNAVRFDVYVTGKNGERTINVVLPFSYGYGDYYMQRVSEYCLKHFGLDRMTVHSLVTSDNIVRKLKKSEVTAWGQL